MADMTTLRIEIHKLGAAEIDVENYLFLTDNKTTSLIMQVTDMTSLLSFITSRTMENDIHGVYLIFSFDSQKDNVWVQDVTFQDDENKIPAKYLSPVFDLSMQEIAHNQLVFKFPDNILDIPEMISLLQAIDDEYNINDFREVLTDVPTEYTEMFKRAQGYD